ncbi:hypothetical protein HPB48_017633 [Haemaphysalis longicornis]|uniref:Uncharacterized protein n=1 Tax=Haemaphysalis longicornis TaxID=44386 RepID=A0A9J6GDF2_HAELO|nr:hypothetical protein HPB48_017633 [Haemaphysalis longicornis]
MAVPPETIEKFKTSGAKITLLNGGKYHPRSRSGCEVHSCKDAAAENLFAGSWPDCHVDARAAVSNAEVERTFSQLKILKSKLRNKMKPETRNAI